MQISGDKNVCPCPSIIHPPYPPSQQPRCADENTRSKYYQEIGAEMIGNELIIRLEKDKTKTKKKKVEWDPPCDCVEIQRPTKKNGPRIINAQRDDRIVFRVHSPSRFQKEETKESAYKSQTIAYKVGSCRDDRDDHRCKTITVYPKLGGAGSQEVYSDHITEGNQDIFLLRIKRKAKSADQRERNVELELRTPKPPTPPPTPPPAPAVEQLPVTDSITTEDAKELETPQEPEGRLNGKKKKKNKRKK